ncbi:Carboxylesterase [Aspergillus ambiguus]|uniref:carboxylesterase/lipase family protein n=1 Tax=Aspergillus ambiguus TaxID=176160 RepID=UPI003CCD5412
MILSLLTISSAFAVTAAASPSVSLEAGTLQGGNCANGRNVVYYKGIPYAEPPLGDLRFEPPKAYSEKYPNGILDASTPAPACIQFGETFVAQGRKDEDCLYLDVWAPSNAAKDSMLPVKVWVYGGSNTDGGITDSLYDGCNLAEDGTILVSINYRLGPLGFMALNSAGIYGNQGIQDLLLGLEWIQESISAFGGDPKKILLFGQSAGATDVHAIATLPQAPSLINSVIAESIAMPSLQSNSSLQKTGVSYAQSLQCGVHDKTCFQSKSIDEIVRAYHADTFLNTGIGSAGPLGISSPHTHKFWPYVDGTVIPENPLTRGTQVPMIVGYNQREGMMDALTRFNTPKDFKSATPAEYTKFLRQNFGPAATIIERYYPLSLFKSTEQPVIAAISTVITDAEYRCPGYQSAVQAASKGMPAWTYEFTHNSSCAWLNTMSQTYIKQYGAAHTAEIPYIFGNLHFDFPGKNSTCTGTPAEWYLSKQMRSLWTAMAENANPSTENVHWPHFQITPKGVGTPAIVFGNSSVPGTIDFSVCRLWDRVNAMLAGNETIS